MGDLYIVNELNKQSKNQSTDVVKETKDSIFVQLKDGKVLISINCSVQFEMKDTRSNRKALLVFLRLLKTENGKHLVTFERLSTLFNLNARQDSNNYYRQFKESGEDLLSFLTRKKKLSEALPEIEKQVLEMPLLSISEQHKLFSTKHPEYKMCLTTFNNYYSQIDCCKLHKRFLELISIEKCHPNKDRILSEILEEGTVTPQKRKVIKTVFPELKETEDKKVQEEISFHKNISKFTKHLLVMFLVASGLNFEVIAQLFGASKSSIHNWFYKLPYLQSTIQQSIKYWSGIITTDEKWIKINNEWFYMLSIVDDKTGFPLYFSLVSDLKADTWKLFFQRFYRLYGKPKLVISDGSKALAKGLRDAFSGVPHQLCKFHKLKNLIRRIYESVEDFDERSKMLKQAIRIFSNTTYFGRKRCAIALMNCRYTSVSSYVSKNILGDWGKLTKGYTSNSAERWNKKIEKVTLGRYGLKSTRFVLHLVTSLWLKEAIKDTRHFEECFLHEINMANECQQIMNKCNILDDIRHNLFGEIV